LQKCRLHTLAPGAEMRDQVSLTRGRQRTYPVIAGRRFRRHVRALWTSPDRGGARGGELSET